MEITTCSISNILTLTIRELGNKKNDKLRDRVTRQTDYAQHILKLFIPCILDQCTQFISTRKCTVHLAVEMS